MGGCMLGTASQQGSRQRVAAPSRFLFPFNTNKKPPQSRGCLSWALVTARSGRGEEEPALLSCVGPDPCHGAGELQGTVGPQDRARFPLGAGSRVLYEAPRRPLPRRGRDKGKGCTDLGRRVNTGCWLLPAPRFPPRSATPEGPTKPQPLSLAPGTPQWRVAKDTAHAGAWWESFIHSSHHLQLRPSSSECPGAGTGATRFIINWVARGGTGGPRGHSGVTAQQRAQPPAPGDPAAPAPCLAAPALAPLSSWPEGR